MSIEVKQLSKKYGDQSALTDVNFSIERGQIVGLLGPNGAGKTTIMKIISGYMTSFGGQAMVNGIDVRAEPIRLKQSIGYLPEHNPLYLDMYIKEYLRFVAAVHHLDEPGASIAKIVERTGLTVEQHKKIGALSKGYRQRVGLAQAMIHDPQVLILDEPTSGLDPNQLVEIRQLIKDISHERTIIFSSHIMQEVQALCDRVIILKRGVLVTDEDMDVLELAINNQRKILVELDKPFEGEWNLKGLVKEHIMSGNRHALTFHKTTSDPRLQIFDLVTGQGYKILEMTEERSSMEEVFQKLTT